METTQENRTNSRIVKAMIDEHIKEFDWDNKKLYNQINHMKNPNETLAKTCRRLVEGGDFLIYYVDVNEFMESLHLRNNSGKTFTDHEAWQMYVKLVAEGIRRAYDLEKYAVMKLESFDTSDLLHW